MELSFVSSSLLEADWEFHLLAIREIGVVVRGKAREAIRLVGRGATRRGASLDGPAIEDIERIADRAVWFAIILVVQEKKVARLPWKSVDDCSGGH